MLNCFEIGQCIHSVELVAGTIVVVELIEYLGINQIQLTRFAYILISIDENF